MKYFVESLMLTIWTNNSQLAGVPDLHWKITAPFFTNCTDDRWIDDFVIGDAHSFQKVPFGSPEVNWHGRRQRATPLFSWLAYWKALGGCFESTEGIITVFPQLAAVAALRRKLTRRSDIPIVAWCFNVGQMKGGARKLIARVALREVERFIVHSKAEVDLLSEYLDVPRQRIRYVPLQRAEIPHLADPDDDEPFVIAMGSANRDYASLIAAARATALPITLVAAPRSVEGIQLPPNVKLRFGLEPAECIVLAQRARFSVIPLKDINAASGQVTVVEALRMGRPLIATRSIGTVDYVEHGRTGLLIPADDPRALADAMLDLWHNSELRNALGEAGKKFAAEHLSDEVAGGHLSAILTEVAANSAPRRCPASEREELTPVSLVEKN